MDYLQTMVCKKNMVIKDVNLCIYIMYGFLTTTKLLNNVF